MAIDKRAVVKELTEYLRKLNYLVSIGFSKFSQQYGLTGSQSRLLRALFDFGNQSSVQLSKRLYVTPANITGIIDRLEKKDLVERLIKKGDRRVSFISLTGKGLNLVQHMPDYLEERLFSGIKNFNQEQLLQIIDSMKDLIQLLDTANKVSDYSRCIPHAQSIAVPDT